MNIKELREEKQKLLKDDYTGVTKLLIIYELDDTINFESLPDEKQEKLLFNIYDYYMCNNYGLAVNDIINNVIAIINWNGERIEPDIKKRIQNLIDLAELDSVDFGNKLDEMI